jgi:hypothetical protein
LITTDAKYLTQFASARRQRFKVGRGGNINRAFSDGAAEVSVDLGEEHSEHNAVEIVTTGSNFRRKVIVEASDSTDEWHTLKTGDVIFSFNSDNSVV